METDLEYQIEQVDETAAEAIRMSLTMLYLGYVEEDSHGFQYLVEEPENLYDLDEEAAEPEIVMPRKWSRIAALVVVAALFLVIGALADRRFGREENKVVAVVNGSIITQQDIEHRAAILSGKPALQQLFDEQLVFQYAKKNKLTPSPYAVESRYDAAIKEPDFFKEMGMAQMTLDDYHQALLYRMTQDAILASGIGANDFEIQDYYKKNCDPKNKNGLFYHSEAVTVAVVLTKSEETIKAAQAALKKGQSFDSVAHQYSEHESKYRGGVLPTILKSTIHDVAWSKIPGVVDTLFDKIQVGEVIGPMKRGPVWLLVLCINHTPEYTDPLDKVKDTCVAAVIAEKAKLKNNSQVTIRKEVNDFVVACTINIFDPRFTDVGANSYEMMEVTHDPKIVAH